MVKVTIVVSKGHEVVKVLESLHDESNRVYLEKNLDGYQFEGHGEYEGYHCEVVGVE